ncbi:deoxyribose-phosphate aldolase [Polaribacter sp.]|nr:deoxyribose-phosphate aldolase [Polaribacter sp.]
MSAEQIIDKAILFSGADKIGNSEVSFKFRDKEYAAIRKNGYFQLSRTLTKDSASIKEVITNNGFQRLIYKKVVKVPDSMVSVYSNAINSVHYFSVLPFGLKDKAVRKKLLKPTNLKGKEYYKIEVTFSENGGGEDFEDVFIYWIGKEDFLIDYLAYSYHTNGGGKRFRVLKEACLKNGVRFVDYLNYKPLNSAVNLIDIDVEYERNQLKKVSEVILEDIKVKFLN